MANVENPSTLKELSIEYAKKQPHQVEHLTEEAPILDQIKFEKSSHGLWNAYEEVTGIEGAGFVDMNAPLPEMNVSSTLKKVDLSIMGGEMFVPEDKAQMLGGRAAYFAKKMPVLLRDAGMSTEKHIIYKNLRKYAIDNENIQRAGATSGGTYSLLCVRWTPGEVVGLYSPEGFKNGAMLDVLPINGGNLYKNDNGVLGYGVRVKGYFGIQLANPEAVSAIVNISAEHLPTEEMIDEMIINAKGKPGSTFIYGHPKVLSMLNKYKAGIMQTFVSDRDVDRTFDKINKITLISSYNFMNGTETVVA